MEEGNPLAPDSLPGGSFAYGLATHFIRFQGSRPSALKIMVRLTLVNGEVLEFEGFQVDDLPEVPGCLMVQGTSVDSRFATIVREADIFRAEFEADPLDLQPFGFA